MLNGNIFYIIENKIKRLNLNIMQSRYREIIRKYYSDPFVKSQCFVQTHRALGKVWPRGRPRTKAASNQDKRLLATGILNVKAWRGRDSSQLARHQQHSICPTWWRPWWKVIKWMFSLISCVSPVACWLSIISLADHRCLH